MEAEPEAQPAAGEGPVLWPIRYGLALPYVADARHPEGELDLGLHAGFLPSNRFLRIGEPHAGDEDVDAESDAESQSDQTVQVRARAASTYARMIAQEDDETVRDSQALEACMHVQPLSGVELAFMTPQPFLSASEAGKALFEVESGRTAQEQLTHRMVQEAAGVDFVPSVVADAIGLSNASTETANSYGMFECMAHTPPAAGFPAFLMFITGLGRDTLNICPLPDLATLATSSSLPTASDSHTLRSGVSQLRAVAVSNVSEGLPRPFIAVTTASSCVILSIVDMGDRSYKLQLEKNITLASQPIEIAFSHHTSDLAIVTSNGTVHLWEANNPKRLRVLNKASGRTDSVGDWVCAFGAHPRSLVLAQRYAMPELVHLDFATEKTVKSFLPLPATTKSIHGLARHPWHPFHLVVTTLRHVMLVDLRNTATSLLAWNHHMVKEPPSYATVLQPYPESLSTYVLVANRGRGEILFLQYTLDPNLAMPSLDNAETRGKDVWDKTGQFCAVFSPERPIGLPSVFALQQYFHLPQAAFTRYDPMWNVSATEFLPKVMLGLSAFITSRDADRDPLPANLHMEVFQMSELRENWREMEIKMKKIAE